jgi:outer membrane cobalamin receptor
MKNITKFICVALFLVSVSTFGFAQESEPQNILDLSLEELMELPVTVASQKALTQRESPGILTVVTKEEIENSGARDLIDVLRLVPGIDFGLDIDQVGISMRGAWGFEGKVLLMMDGLELNELLYGTTQFGNHYPVANIKRIEVIRGPGSAIYGGRAELGVINIITETGQDIDGIKATANYGQTGKSKRGNLNIGLGKKINNFELSVDGFIGNGNRSDRTYYSHDMTDSTNLKPTSINGKIKFKGLEANVIFDRYQTETNEYGGLYSNDYESLLGGLKYRFSATNKLSITPSVSYFRSTPWSTSYVNTDGVEALSDYKVSISKIKPGIEANFDASEKINLTAGVEYYTETGKYANDTVLFWNKKNSATISNTIVYAQALIKNNIVNITLGGRVENNSEYGTAFAPRIGLTKSFDKLHAKLLFSQAFRSPALGNIDSYESYNPESNSDIEPEKTRVIEFEAGYKLSKDMAITANIFYININKPIVYAGTYENKDQTGTKGFELEYRIRKNWGYVNVNYAYYSAQGINKVTEYSVPDSKGSLLATPQHKVNLNGSFNLTKKLTINPTITYLGERYGNGDPVFNEGSNNWEYPIVKIKPTLLANVFLTYRNVLINNLNIGVGCYNLFNKEHKFIQAYTGGYLPMPSQTREFVVKLSYKI